MSTKKRVLTVIGTRPEIIKMAPVIPVLDRLFEQRLIHSGQHYSTEMDSSFFEELALRKPDANLQVGSIGSATQVGRIMEGLEREIAAFKPHAVVIQGDTNTTLAGALCAAKHRADGVKLVHIEALARSYNELQAEEINRRIADQLSHLLLGLYPHDIEVARREGIPAERVAIVGNTVADGCLRMASVIDDAVTLRRVGVNRGEFVFVTCHRQETVDSRVTLTELFRALREIARRISVVFAIHPRTRTRALEFGVDLSSGNGFHALDPLGYRDTIALVKNARFCMSDSGGLLEEAATLRTPMLILRNEVEQTYFVDAGIHSLVPPSYRTLTQAADQLLDDPHELARRRDVQLLIRTGVPEAIGQKIAELLG